MKVLAFAGSSSSKSINRKLVAYTVSLFKKSSIEIIDLNSYEMPIYSSDRQAASGIPELASDFAKKIDAADFLVISLAEHNGAYSTAFKNVYDWVSRIPNRKVWAGKNIFLLATSPGARGGAAVLEIAKNRFPHDNGTIKATFSLPSFGENFIEGQGISNQELDNQLKNIITSLDL